MKKYSIFIVALIWASLTHAQGIYTKVLKYDKFDDVVSSENIKTLIIKTDSTIVIETKGSEPETFRYFDAVEANHIGSKDNLVNLVENIWGYQSDYPALSDKDYAVIRAKIQTMRNNCVGCSETELMNKFSNIVDESMKKVVVITFRTISQYSFTFEYDTDMVWIRYPDGSRIIYRK